jgi:hypothetical protein
MGAGKNIDRENGYGNLVIPRISILKIDYLPEGKKGNSGPAKGRTGGGRWN